MEHVEIIDGIILTWHCLCISVDKGSSFFLSPLKHTALEILSVVASWLPYDESRAWPNPESLPLTSLYIPSQNNEEPHPSVWLVSYALPIQWWLWGLRHHNEPLCPSTLVSGCWGRPWYNFLTPDTSVCLILGSGDSGAWCFFSWPSDFPSVPFILWRICPSQHSCLLHPCMNLYQTPFPPNLFLRVV